MSDDVTFLSQLVRDSMELQAQEAMSRSVNRDLDAMTPLQVLPRALAAYLWEPPIGIPLM